MTTSYTVNFLSQSSKTNFEDYYLQITDIFVCNANTLILDEMLNSQNSKYSSRGFSFSGEGFKGYKVSLRMDKQAPLIDENELVEYVSQAISKVYSNFKTA